MNDNIKNFEPARLWNYFAEILELPRPSKNEEKIIKYLMDFGNKMGLETLQDSIGNVLIRKPATSGMESCKTVVLQSHVDMVCEKNSDKIHDFFNDPIISRVEGEWVKASGTTLGADDGIGIATQLAILEATDIQHGPIECLFTIDEETGLTGAFGLEPGFLKGDILLNLDSEDEGELFIGCAGGKDTVAEFSFKKLPANHGDSGLKISVTGLTGGHSGDDINKGLGNANKILNRLLWELDKDYGIEVSDFNGGNLRNAIAREAFAVITTASVSIKSINDFVSKYTDNLRFEYRITEPNLNISCTEMNDIPYIIDTESKRRLLNSIYACPHGVIAMSQSIANFVETSTNLASVKFKDEKIIVTTSQRSSIESSKEDICQMVESVFKLVNAQVTHSDGYPGWTPNPDSAIVEITKTSFIKVFGYNPKVIAIHAGLECGLIGEKYPNMDMISFGPTIKGAHSPDERLKIDTVKRFWDLTIDVLNNIPKN